ncbi:hypothetical protein [Mycobacterium intracellulare]|uniref:hypothetical protein n=1 Tax=Mycobacterium intracellulare TaxID=1767 RepID=UPI00192733A5|nr:hypothetical protein [Mycobacterium intracellulare]BCP29575.1 hypothetical protein MINTM026_05450 [Mycobacterium intracellulare]
MIAKFTGPVRRIETAKGHYYKDANGHRIPGVTTMLGDGVPKPALINWAANATAEYAVDNWDQLTELQPSARLKQLQGARYSVTDKAKKRGTEVHRYAELLVKGEQVQGIPDELRGHVEAYVRFLDKFEVDPILVEATIVSYRYGYAGTLDLVAEVTYQKQRRTLLLDAKTNEKGIFGETALQLAAYRYADFYLDADGKEQPMVDVEGCGAILVNSEQAQLIPCTSGPEQFKSFRIAAAMRDIVNGSRDLVGTALEPDDPNPSTARLVYQEQQP